MSWLGQVRSLASHRALRHPGADALNHQVSNRYTADQIIATEGVVLETIDWQLMNFPLYDYVKLFIS